MRPKFPPVGPALRQSGMPHDSQIDIPASFVALFVPPGRIKPTASRAEIQTRYEYCEDLANLLTDTASTQLWQLGITEDDVLSRVHAGLLGGQAGVNEAEAPWVTHRLAELLGWSYVSIDGPAPGPDVADASE